jgi:S-adenosylmethionine:tRNA ribosyltransferase-isomerase
MLVDLFNFDLPEDRIALRPVRPRDAARMLVVSQNKQFLDKHVSDLPFTLRAGDALVINNTKVIHARLKGQRLREGNKATIEATLIKRVDNHIWEALVKPAKRLQITLLFEHSSTDLEQSIQSIGALPLPPYIAGKRDPDKYDEIDYQTYFASEPGAVAAPTAGLHFTQELINKLLQYDIHIFSVTLHVGAGTFLPVKVENTADHVMHKEYAYLNKETADQLNEIKRNGGRIVAVGTTALRVLESASDESGYVKSYSDFTDIFITPGYEFKFTDLLLTNFHLPKSTLFMLVSAFAGLDTMHQAYKYAIDSKYRFYSYGDACLLSREII